MATIGQIQAAKIAMKGKSGKLNSRDFVKQADKSYSYVPGSRGVAPKPQVQQGFQSAIPKFGDKGSNVSAYQTYLNTQNQGKAGYTPLKVDSIFGPKTQAASNISTTTLSNGNKIDSIPGMVNDFTNLANKGISTDAEGNSRYADGSFVPEKSAATDYSEQDQQIQDIMDDMKASTDASTNEQIDNLRQKFAQRKSEQAAVNTASSKAVQNALLMGGATGQGSSSQYAPISSQGIVTAQESYGIKQLAALDSAENDAIAEARAAQQAQNYKLMESKINMINDVRQQKLSLASKLNEQAALANQQAQIDMAVAQVYDSGITDPAEALKALRKMGVPADAKRVTDTLALLTGSGGTGIIGEYNFYKNDATRRGQVPVDFNTYQNMDANRKKSIAKAGVSGGGTTTDEDGNIITTGNYDALTIGRYNRAVNAATAILQKNPTFKNIIGSSAYLDRIEAASQNPGSVGDQELLDAFTQLNTGGNRVTEAQVHLITGSGSIADALSKFGNKLKKGGSLSSQQRKEIIDLSHEVYKNYQKSYLPLYKDATARLQAQGIPKEFWNIPSPDTLSRAVSDVAGSTAEDIIQSEDQAKEKIDTVAKTNPAVAKIVYDSLSKPDPTLGRVMTYSEIMQYLQAIGKI